MESIIREYPGIKDATVVAFDEPAGGKFIAAYVVSDERVDIDSLNAFIRSSKPPYMVPAVTMQIDRIPLNQNQKVNRRALPVPVRQTATEIKLPETALCHNIPAELKYIQPGSIGNVLLTGPVGFLGIHVLKALIDKTDARVYCLMHKSKGKIEAGRMLRINLFLYFDDPMEKLMDNRIFVLEGDITDPDSLRKLPTEKFDTVINCAANVRHFDSDGSIERVNTYGAKVLADFCSEFGKRLIQVSTGSVAGTADPDMDFEGMSLKECELFIGQKLDNKYIHSKYMAEQYILKAVAEGKLDAKIIRVGNLMSRYTDGELQKNFESNNFMRQLRAYVTLGCIPVSALDAAVEFSPIDKTAEALVLLGGTDSRFTVFQASNGHIIEMGDVVDALNSLDLPVEVVTDEEFAVRIREVPYDNRFTVKALYRLGFKWPTIESKYLRSAIEALKTLDFFV